MILLSWICTLLVLIGFYLNAKQKLYHALIIWIVGDVGWIVFDFHIQNWSHAVLSTTIILINLYGLYNSSNTKE